MESFKFCCRHKKNNCVVLFDFNRRTGICLHAGLSSFKKDEIINLENSFMDNKDWQEIFFNRKRNLYDGQKISTNVYFDAASDSFLEK